MDICMDSFHRVRVSTAWTVIIARRRSTTRPQSRATDCCRESTASGRRDADAGSGPALRIARLFRRARRLAAPASGRRFAGSSCMCCSRRGWRNRWAAPDQFASPRKARASSLIVASVHWPAREAAKRRTSVQACSSAATRTHARSRARLARADDQHGTRSDDLGDRGRIEVRDSAGTDREAIRVHHGDRIERLPYDADGSRLVVASRQLMGADLACRLDRCLAAARRWRLDS